MIHCPKKAKKSAKAPAKVSAPAAPSKAAARSKEPTPGICRVCGCTEHDACDPPCHWVDIDETLCSACADMVCTGTGKKYTDCTDEELYELVDKYKAGKKARKARK